jgi:hypothetical protein
MTYEEMVEQVQPILEEYIASAQQYVDVFIYIYRDGYATTFGIGCPACAYEGILEWAAKNPPKHVAGEKKPTIN